MAWVMALAAFAALMAMLASLVTVALEGWHKAFALRRAGLAEMMRALHDNVLRDPLVSGYSLRTGATTGAKAFSRQMTTSVAYAGHGRWWWPRNWPILNLIFFQPRLERLSTLQFAEQLGQSDVGRTAAATMADAERRVFLNRVVHEFHRYGELQSDYFRRRAKAAAAFLAFLLVAIGNINGYEIYVAMATNPGLTARAQAALTPERSAALSADLQAAQSRIAELQTAIDSTAAADGAAGLQTALGAARLQAQSLQAALDATRIAMAPLKDAGLPMGPERFPYCLAGVTGAPASPDPRCPAAAAPAGPAQTAAAAARRVATPDGFLWLMQIIATAGLLGLGAPFWFSVARTVSLLAASRGGVQPAASGATPTPVRTASAPIARPAEPTLSDLDEAFVRTAGVSPAPPRGARHVAPGGAPASPGGPGAAGPGGGPAVLAMRQVRG